MIKLCLHWWITESDEAKTEQDKRNVFTSNHRWCSTRKEQSQTENIKKCKTHPLHSKGANCVFSECLCLKKSDFDVTIHLGVLWPIFAAFHLFQKREGEVLNNIQNCKTVENVRVVSLQTENSQDTIYFLSFKLLFLLLYTISMLTNGSLCCVKSLPTLLLSGLSGLVYGFFFMVHKPCIYRLHHEPTALCWIPTDRQR